MDFVIEQRFVADPDAVQGALVDPEFLAQLGSLPGLGTPELLAREEHDGTVRMQVRYRYTGDLNVAVTRVLDRSKLSWVEDSVCDLARRRTEWRILPDHYPDRLRCGGVFQLAVVGDGTLRTATGQLRVPMPIVGGRVERAIVSGLRDHAAEEASALTAWLAARDR